MEAFLVILNGALWFAVLALALVVFALTRQVHALSRRIMPAGALSVNARLQPGEPAPVFALTDLQDNAVAIGNSGVQQLLFFLAPDCPICKTLLPVVRRVQREENGLQIVLASDGASVSVHKAFVQREQLSAFPYVLSEPLGVAYGVSKLPYGVLIGADGRISALGILNSREHIESLFEAARLGVASIQAYVAREQGGSSGGVRQYDPG